MSKINFVTLLKTHVITEISAVFPLSYLSYLLTQLPHVKVRNPVYFQLCDLTNHTRQVPDRDMPPSRVPRALLSWNILGHWLADNGSKFLLNFIEIRSKGK